MEWLRAFGWVSTVFMFVYLGLYLFYRVRFMYWGRMKVEIVGDPEFLFGNVRDVIKVRNTYEGKLAEWYRKYKGRRVIGVYNLFVPVLIVLDLELINNILVKDFEHFQDHYSVCNKEVDPLSENLFFMSTDEWKRLRNKITPIFSSTKLKSMFETILKCSDELDYLDSYVDNSEGVDIKKIITLYTTNVIGSCFFGIEPDCFNNPENVFSTILVKHLIPSRPDRFRLFLNHFFPGLCRLFRIRQINQETDQFIRNLTYDTAEHRRKNNVTRRDFLQLLLDAKVGLNTISAQTFLFFIGGFETSSSTMSFCLYELAKNPSIQEKTRQEILSVLKKHNNQINYNSIQDMPYLERVLLETSRKHPSLGFLTRKVTKDYRIPNSDIVLEKGMAVFIPSLGIHYDPEYYPDPDRFDPDRFLFENRASRPNTAHLSFGLGQRICIGMRFGLLQIKVGLCRLLSKYRFSLNPKTVEPLLVDNHSLVRSIQGGIWMDIEKI